MTANQALKTAFRRITNLVCRYFKVLKLDIQLQDLDNGDDQMLINKLLSQLNLEIKLCHVLIVVNVEVLRIEEWHFVRIFSDLVSVDLLCLRPLHVLFQDDSVPLVSDLWVGRLARVQVLQCTPLHLNEQLSAQLWLIHIKVMSLVHAPEVDVERLVDQLLVVNLEFKNSEIDHNMIAFTSSVSARISLEINVVIGCVSHGTCAILFDDADFKVH